MPADKMQRMQLVIQPALIEDIDRWRGQQPGVPNRSEAVRNLISIALQAEAEKEGHHNKGL